MDIWNLAMESTVDWDIVTKLKMANTNLTEVFKNLTEQLGVEMSTIQQLTNVTGDTQGTKNNATEENPKNWKNTFK